MPRKAGRVRLDPSVPAVEGARPATGALAGIALRDDPNPGLLRGTLHALYDVMWIVTTLLGLPWLLWKSARTAGFGRMVLQRLGRGLGDVEFSGKTARVLVHGVSVGEVKGSQVLVQAIEEAFPGLEVVITTTTDTGLEVARDLFPGHRVLRFPADISFLVRRFLRVVDPAFLVLMELEIWPNFLRECNRAGVPVAVVNGRITTRSHGQYLVFRKLLPQFNRISLFCVQSREYAQRFGALSVDPRRILITGNIKADGLRTGPVKPAEELRAHLGPEPGQLVIVAGSTHEPEERYVVEAWQEGAPDARLILVPRHPRRCDELVRDFAARGVRLLRLSRLRTGAEEPDPRQPVLVDTIGELEQVYGLADVVFVGGSLIAHGGQNMLEPAAQGRPVLFGPHVTNFRQEASLLLSAGACRQVEDAGGLADTFADLLADDAARERMSRAGRAAVEAQKGATQLTVDALSELYLGQLDAREP